MAREALGMVQTLGWVGAVEAADAMCKAAQVRLTRLDVVPDAIVTVLVRGSVADVEAAVAAGTDAAARVGELLRGHVIPAPDSDLESPVLSANGAPPVL